MAVTVGTDVVVIALYANWDLNVTELWIYFCIGKDRRWLPVHSHAELLTIFRMGFFGPTHGSGGVFFGPLSLKSVTHILQ